MQFMEITQIKLSRECTAMPDTIYSISKYLQENILRILKK